MHLSPKPNYIWVKSQIVVGSGAKLHLGPRPSLNVCVSVTMYISVRGPKTKLHLGRDEIVVRSGTKSHLVQGPCLNVCVSVAMCMDAFESKTKSHLGEGSNCIWIWDLIWVQNQICMCVCECDNVHECI